jgi:hypothetical protein
MPASEIPYPLELSHGAVLPVLEEPAAARRIEQAIARLVYSHEAMMGFDGPNQQADRQDGISPSAIAHNDLFTAKEKIELLSQMKADLTVAQQEGLEPAFSLEEIDRAIAEVRQDIEEGHGTETLSRGDA